MDNYEKIKSWTEPLDDYENATFIRLTLAALFDYTNNMIDADMESICDLICTRHCGGH